MRYVLDTNILSELLKKRPNPHLIARLRSKQPGALFTSCICVMELRFGAALRGDAEIFWEKITEEILSKVTILLIGSLEAVTAGDLLASFQKAGQIIGMEDSPSGKVVTAEVPLAEMFQYSTAMRSMSQGRANYTMEFAKYMEVPGNVADAVMKIAS